MDLYNLRITLLKLLPILLIALGLFVVVFFGVARIFPQWKIYATLEADVVARRDAVAAQFAAQMDDDTMLVLQHQIENMEEQLSGAATAFLTRGEAEQLLDRLYAYAYSRGVRITNLQAQQAQQPQQTEETSENSTSGYEIHQFQLQVAGGVANLIDFIAQFREASLPSVNIVSMTVVRQENQALLTMVLLIYTSEHASGLTLSQMVVPVAFEPSPTPTETPTVAPTLPPTATLSPKQPTPLPPTATTVPTNTPTVIPSATFTFTPTFTPSPVMTTVYCPGAMNTLFRPGDIAVVDFNDMGALRVLSDPNASVIATRTQAYDNDVLEILAGPVCANSSYYWYVRNRSSNNALGWVAEGQGDERWLCPENASECTS
ncbi:MAG: hypothetical protein IPK19_01235 [Chloroflexi bacterium]|nr:hypothetical protein [Chloroflexota bacterium]